MRRKRKHGWWTWALALLPWVAAAVAAVIGYLMLGGR